jgi:hypothetical protein
MNYVTLVAYRVVYFLVFVKVEVVKNKSLSGADACSRSRTDSPEQA